MFECDSKRTEDIESVKILNNSLSCSNSSDCLEFVCRQGYFFESSQTVSYSVKIIVHLDYLGIKNSIVLL